MTNHAACKNYPVAALALAMAALCSCPAIATDTEQAGTASPDAIETVVVTAERRSENLERTPVAVSVLSGVALKEQAIVSEADLQTAVPGLIVRGTQDSNQLNFALRGQSVDAFTSSRPAVLPYVDEVAIDNSASSAFYDLASVQVLKGPQGTLFGRNATGGAVLFTTAPPADQFGGYLDVKAGDYDLVSTEGAINLPIVDDKLLVRVAGYYEHRDGYQHNLYNNTTIGDENRHNARISVTFAPTSAITNNFVVDYADTSGSSTAPSIYSAYPVGGTPSLIAANVLFSPALDAAVGAPGAWNSYLAAHSQIDPAGLVAYAAVQRARGPFVVNLNSPLFHDASTLLVSDVTTFDLADDVQIKNVLGFLHVTTKDSADIDGTPFGVEGTGFGGIVNRSRQLTEELQLLGSTPNQTLIYVAGFYYSDETAYYAVPSDFLDLSPVLPVTSADFITRPASTSYAGYAQGTYDLSGLTGVAGLGFTAGLRYTSERVSLKQLPGSAFFGLPDPPFQQRQVQTTDKLSWQFGLQDQVSDGLLLYAVTRHSFRSGGFNATAAPLPGTAAVGGASFAPEVATDVEVGAKFQGNVSGLPIRLNLAAYNQWVSNIQRSIYGLAGGQPGGFTVNVPGAEVSGFEFEGEIDPVSWLNVGTSVAFADARFTNDTAVLFGVPTIYGPYPDTPRWSGTIFAQASMPIDAEFAVSLRADFFAQSSYYFSSLNGSVNPGSKLPGYGLANFRVALDDTQANWSLAAYIRNAFDQTYYVGGVPEGALLGINTALPGDPRTVFLEASYKF